LLFVCFPLKAEKTNLDLRFIQKGLDVVCDVITVRVVVKNLNTYSGKPKVETGVYATSTLIYGILGSKKD